MSENSGRLDRILPVLSVIKQTEHSRLRLGRKTVLKELEDRGLFFSEQEIRTLFQTLAFYRLIRITRGRGGTCITGLGIKAYNLMMEKMERLRQSRPNNGRKSFLHSGSR